MDWESGNTPALARRIWLTLLYGVDDDIYANTTPSSVWRTVTTSGDYILQLLRENETKCSAIVSYTGSKLPIGLPYYSGNVGSAPQLAENKNASEAKGWHSTFTHRLQSLRVPRLPYF